MKLRELVVMYESRLMAQWDHTSAIVMHLHNLTAMVHNMVAKGRKIKGITFEEAHPYRVKPRKGFKVTAENIDVLREIASGVIMRKD